MLSRYQSHYIYRGNKSIVSLRQTNIPGLTPLYNILVSDFENMIGSARLAD